MHATIASLALTLLPTLHCIWTRSGLDCPCIMTALRLRCSHLFSPRHPARCCAMNHVLGSAESCFRVGCVCISPWLLQVIILCSKYQLHACVSPSAVLWHVDYTRCCGYECKSAFADGNGIGVRASPRTNYCSRRPPHVVRNFYMSHRGRAACLHTSLPCVLRAQNSSQRRTIGVRL